MNVYLFIFSVFLCSGVVCVGVVCGLLFRFVLVVVFGVWVLFFVRVVLRVVGNMVQK